MVDLTAKAQAVRLLLLDIDGIFTDGMIYLGDFAGTCKGFHIQDGLGVKLLQQTGVQIGVISGKKASYLQTRLESIGVTHIYLGHERKLPVYEELKAKLQLSDHEIAYMGDDLIDLPLLSRVGLAATVPDGHEAVKPYAHYISKYPGGKGAVRDLCDLIMRAQGHYDAIVQSYL